MLRLEKTIEEAKRIRSIFNDGGSFYRHEVTRVLDEMIWSHEEADRVIKELRKKLKDIKSISEG